MLNGCSYCNNDDDDILIHCEKKSDLTGLFQMCYHIISLTTVGAVQTIVLKYVHVVFRLLLAWMSLIPPRMTTVLFVIAHLFLLSTRERMEDQAK